MTSNVSSFGSSFNCTVASVYEWAPDSTNNNVSKWTLKCGNGVINSPEAWDDKNNVSGDGCSSTCTIETGYEWAPDSQTTTFLNELWNVETELLIVLSLRWQK